MKRKAETSEKFTKITIFGKNASKLQECLIQIPSSHDRFAMLGLPAGGSEDQYERLLNMTNTLLECKDQSSWLSIFDTESSTLPDHWNKLFIAIKQSKKELAFKLLDELPINDVILKPLLMVHSKDYLKKIIELCILAKKEGTIDCDNDIVMTPDVFEVLIKDIGVTLLKPSKVRFSFGLPTHHAFSDQGSGFCILNKTAVLIKHAEQLYDDSLNVFVLGSDVNRDNGLSAIFRSGVFKLPIKHIDIFDSRVYPYQDNNFIKKEFGSKGNKCIQGINSWEKENYEYYAVDLSTISRKKISLHPAILFAVDALKKHIEETKKSGKKTMLFLPTGWDSHLDETAFCGKNVGDHTLSIDESLQYRFHDSDLKYFYDRLFQLYKENTDCVEGIYWGLEGGYDKSMYEQQIKLLINSINMQFYPNEVPQKQKGFGYIR